MHALEGKRFVVASHNEGKLREFADLLAPFGFEAKSAREYGLPEPEETGTTFEENAYIKAFAAAKATGLPAMSDDSGLCVDALDGAPGVYTANWAEKPDGSRDFGMAMQKTEDALQKAGALEPAQRTGRFVAVICLAFPDGEAEYYRGEVDGKLVWSPRGDLIAFTKQTGGEFQIGVMRADGSGERILSSAFQEEGPTWAPNGRVLMFFSAAAGAAGPKLHTIDLTGRNEQEVPTPNFASDPAWSPLLE